MKKLDHGTRTLLQKFLLTTDETALALGVSREYVRQLVISGRLKRVALPETFPHPRRPGRPARLLRIDRRDVEALISRSKT